ncbi:MAG: SH3 domain-containing protein [Myxococcota bacterium]
MLLPSLLLVLGSVTPFEEAKGYLAACELKSATTAGERARKADAGSREILTFLAAVYDATGDQKNAKSVYRALKRLPAPDGKPAPPLVVPKDVAVGQKRFIASARTRLRLDPKPDAEVLQELHVNDALTVEELSDEWVRVTALSGDTEFAGWVHAGLTAAARVDVDRTLADARAKAKANDWAAAWRLLDLVVDARPGQPEVERELRAAAINAGNFKRAVMTCPLEQDGSAGNQPGTLLLEELTKVADKCRHWRGEDPYDDARAAFLSEQVDRDCTACETLRTRALKQGGREASLPRCDD